MESIKFETNPQLINGWTIIIFPELSSKMLPSRGMVMIEGTINKIPFRTTLEPDGNGSHWFRGDDTLCVKANIRVGQTVSIDAIPTNTWIEPELPVDLLNALKSSNLEDWWFSLTTKARWEWIRWIRSTPNPQTRQNRIKVACSKMADGEKRPCCFNQSHCTVIDVSKSGVLMTDV